MNKTKICIIGAGNISNTRHIPALKKVGEAEIVGVISNREDRARRTAVKHRIDHHCTITDNIEDNISQLSKLDWFQSVDAVVIGAPPHLHYGLVKAALKLNKHVLVEKPMMMDESECNELIELARSNKRVFYVMHNFQYANKMLKMNKIIDSEVYGPVGSITEIQFTNHERRLPEWYNDLPMGLFYDEAAHFVYLLERHAGKLTIDNSYAVYDSDKKVQTPRTLSVNATAGKVPVTMMLDFHSPVCEWYYIVNFKKRILIYDFFKDILIDLPTDNEHLAADILRNSWLQTWQYWSQFIANGFRMITGNLLYGHDRVLGSFVSAVRGGDTDENLIASNGRKNVISINEIISKANGK